MDLSNINALCLGGGTSKHFIQKYIDFRWVGAARPPAIWGLFHQSDLGLGLAKST